MHESRIRLLVLYANYTNELSYFDDWMDALRGYPPLDTVALDIVPLQSRRELRKALGEVDAVVLLHSTNGDSTVHLDRLASLLTARRAPLLAFVGNELNLPGKSIVAKRRVLGEIQPEWIATQLLEEAGRFLFGDLALRDIVSIPHALNPSVFVSKIESARRPIDVGTRVMRYPPHLGDDDRNRIAARFVEVGKERGLKVDISNERRARAGWVEFLNRCKGTVSTEAGSWFLERDDATVNAIRRVTREQVGGIEIAEESAFMNFGYRLPTPLRRTAARLYRMFGGRFEYQTVAEEPCSYEEIHSRFFAGKPRAPAYGKCISSRHFDAIGTKTCQIMLRGRFNDILEADWHYLALDDDFGNLDEVLRRFLDPSERRSIVDAAYAHVMESHTYVNRMRQIETLLRTA